MVSQEVVAPIVSPFDEVTVEQEGPDAINWIRIDPRACVSCQDLYARSLGYCNTHHSGTIPLSGSCYYNGCGPTFYDYVRFYCGSRS